MRGIPPRNSSAFGVVRPNFYTGVKCVNSLKLRNRKLVILFHLCPHDRVFLKCALRQTNFLILYPVKLQIGTGRNHSMLILNFRLKMRLKKF